MNSNKTENKLYVEEYVFIMDLSLNIFLIDVVDMLFFSVYTVVT